MPSIKNLVHQTSSSTGTGNLTLATVNGKQSFATAFGTGAPTDVFYYFISNRNAAEWEFGTGHMSDSTTLVRDTVIESTNSNAAVSFSSGTLDVVNDLPWNKQVNADDLATVATSGAYSDLSGTPSLATVATSGAYSDLSGTPVIGTDVQAHDADLDTIAGLSPSNDDFLQRKAGAWANRTIAQVKTDLSLSGSNTGDQTSVSGNAGTATALQTARTIDGQSFDGTGNITVIAPGTHAATSKSTPVDADELPIVDSAASNVLKKLTWANLKATLKTYLDTLYQPVATILTALAGLSNASGYLKNNGSGTLSWDTPSGGGMDLLATLATTSGSTVSVTGIPAGYRALYIEFDVVQGAGSSKTLQIQISTGGASYGTAINLSGSLTSSAGYVLGAAWVYGIWSTGVYKQLQPETYSDQGGGFTTFNGVLPTETSGAVTAVQFKWSSGNFSAGAIRVYGVK